jgi:hypothetical protein
MASKYSYRAPIRKPKDCDVSSDETYRVRGVPMLTIKQYLDRLKPEARKVAESALLKAGFKMTWVQTFPLRKLDSIVEQYSKLPISYPT